MPNDWSGKDEHKQPTPCILGADGEPLYPGNIRPADDQDQKDIHQALREAIERKKKNPDYFQKQLDGVLPPKPIRDPSHYHISYEHQGYTYPYTQQSFVRARLAYLEMWRLMSLSIEYGEPEFDEGDGTITIFSPLKGRTGVHPITLRAVSCMLIECASAPSPLEPIIGRDPTDGQDYDREIGAGIKRIES